MIEYNEITSKALHNLCPNGWSLNGADFKSVSDPQPTQEELDTEIAKVQSEHDAQAYARNRQAEYPDWGSQLNKIYDDGIEKWKTEMVDPIKAKYPK